MTEKQREKERIRIQKETEEFLKKGGKIKNVNTTRKEAFRIQLGYYNILDDWGLDD